MERGEEHGGRRERILERDLLGPAPRPHSPCCPRGPRRANPALRDCAPGTERKDQAGLRGQRNPGDCLQGEEGGGQGAGFGGEGRLLKGKRRRAGRNPGRVWGGTPESERRTSSLRWPAGPAGNLSGAQVNHL